MANSHGHARHGAVSTTYRSWIEMRRRCRNPKPQDQKWYAGAIVCERWRSFENFLSDMGEKPAGTSIDRFPVSNGAYEPGNCRWATVLEQIENRNLSTGKATKTHCANGHEINSENAKYIGSHRYCRACNRECQRRRAAKRRELSQ